MNRVRRKLLGSAVLGLPLAAAAADARLAALASRAPTLRQPAGAALLAAAQAGTRLVAVGERGVVLLSDDGGQRWRQAPQVPTSVTLTALRFSGERHGLAVGHGGVVLSTEDGGERWQLRADGRRLADIALQRARALVAEGAPRAAALLREAELLVADGPDKPMLDLLLLNGTRHVVVVGAYNLAFETRDGGASWQPLLDRLDNPKARHLYALGASGESWLLAGEQGLLLHSADGGQRFERLASPYSGSWFTLASTAQGRWLLAGLRGQVWTSDDDGHRWSHVGLQTTASIVHALARADGSVLLAAQSGELHLVPPAGPARLLPGPPLPPPSQLLSLPDGHTLVVGLGGCQRLPPFVS